MGGGLFSDSWAGRNFPFGIREHAMGSIVNGIERMAAARAVRVDLPDLQRLHAPGVRLSALMELPVVWVWTHDSVGLGEDGPTHEPVETSPPCARSRPSGSSGRRRDRDGRRLEDRARARDGPVALSLSRQKVPTLDRSELAPASGLDAARTRSGSPSPRPT